MAGNFDSFRKLLEELFQLDQADLDFGIYRIMGQKRDEVVSFLDKDLLPQVKDAFSQYQSADKIELQQELDKLISSVTSAGMNPDNSPKVQKIRQKIDESSVDVETLEQEVFSHLYSFFRRYYHEGDFISLRRYKEGVYAIPYEGEEVKLHWANHDQYYIKSSEYFRDYTFTVASGNRVRVHLTAASTEQDNKKEAAGKERRFIICAEDPVYEKNGELYIRFEYRPHDGKKKQDRLNEEAIARVLVSEGLDDWGRELSKPAPTAKNPKRTVLEKHLTKYTSRNTFDYFIHKDLGGFLRRELDFYIKNEVMHLDDIENDTIQRVEQYLSKVMIIRKIAHKVILFLEQLEHFQKKLWLKKKFVVETNYCITLDRVPEELYPEIAANDMQREEWVRLFAINEIQEINGQIGYTVPLTVEFLRSHQALLLDTQFFGARFKEFLLESLDDVDGNCNGLLIQADNFQALELLRSAYSGKVKCVYLDPPYNTGSSSILYKNSYRHSSWATFMRDRLALLRPLMPEDGAIFVSIDKTERAMLENAMDQVFGTENRVEELIWAMNTNNSQAPNYSTNHEYVLVYAKNRSVVEQDRYMFREPKPGYEEVIDLITSINSDYPSVSKIERQLGELYSQHKVDYRDEVEAAGLDWDKEKGNDLWKGLYNYSRAEYRNAKQELIKDSEAKEQHARIWVWQEGDASMPATKQADSTQDETSPNYRFYKPLHPITGKPCPHPKSGWKFRYNFDENNLDRRCFVSLEKDKRIAWGEDAKKVPRLKRMLHEVETNVGKSVFQDYSDGEKQTSAMFGKSGVFLAPKHSQFVSRFITHAAKNKETSILDCFGGSGSTAQAVIDLNRIDVAKRKFILVEVGHYFETVLKPRVLKSVYSIEWKQGKPVSRSSGVSQCLKYLKLESYEDTLNNLELKRTQKQQLQLEINDDIREDYTLSYMLDVETRGSQSLLNIESFRNPDEYKLKVERDGETTLVNVDLVETFNWLIGLSVKHIDRIRGIRVVEGVNPEGERVLVLWRNLDETDNDALDRWFSKQDYNTREQVYDLFYINGDNNLENLCRVDQTWKVRLIEEEFKRLMFDVQDV